MLDHSLRGETGANPRHLGYWGRVAAALGWLPDETPEEADTTMTDEKSLRERMTRQGEEAVGKFAQELLDNPVVSSALSAAFEARERATRAQEVAMGALNLPSASDLERLTRRLRGVSQRLEGIEDGLDRVEQKLSHFEARLDQQAARAEERTAATPGDSAG